jgi:hypothetical protein
MLPEADIHILYLPIDWVVIIRSHVVSHRCLKKSCCLNYQVRNHVCGHSKFLSNAGNSLRGYATQKITNWIFTAMRNYFLSLLFSDAVGIKTIYIYIYIYSVDDKMINVYGAVGKIRIYSGNQSNWRKHALMPLCQPQTPRDLIWNWTRAGAAGSRRLTFRGMAQPVKFKLHITFGKTVHS